MTTPLDALKTVWRTHAYRLRYRPQVHFVSDGRNWSFDWDAHYLQRGLNALNVPTHLTTTPERLLGQIIHYGDRYAYLTDEPVRLHPSNYVFVTWFHGHPTAPEFSDIAQRLRQRVKGLRGIVTSCQTAYHELATFGIPTRKLRVIPLGVDLAHFTPATPDKRAAIRAELGIAPDAVCIGSFQKDGTGWGEGEEPKLIKGPDTFLAVIERIAPHLPTLHVILTGPARGYVKTGLQRLGIPFTHRQLDHYPDIARIYHALDVYLITSRAEGGPKALMEAWASGVPVVSTRMGMPADHIRHGQNGHLAPLEGVDELAQAALSIIQRPAHAQALIQQALSDVQALSWERIATHYAALYRPILRSNK